MESVIATFAKIEKRKRKNRKAVKKAHSKKDLYMKVLMNQKSSLENDIEKIHEECTVIKGNQKAHDLEKTNLRAETAILDQYMNLLSQYYIIRHGM